MCCFGVLFLMHTYYISLPVCLYHLSVPPFLFPPFHSIVFFEMPKGILLLHSTEIQCFFIMLSNTSYCLCFWPLVSQLLLTGIQSQSVSSVMYYILLYFLWCQYGFCCFTVILCITSIFIPSNSLSKFSIVYMYKCEQECKSECMLKLQQLILNQNSMFLPCFCTPVTVELLLLIQWYTL